MMSSVSVLGDHLAEGSVERLARDLLDDAEVLAKLAAQVKKATERRNERIVELAKLGRTYDSIGRLADLSKQRIQKIVEPHVRRRPRKKSAVEAVAA
jgi:hypothetical protein